MTDPNQMVGVPEAEVRQGRQLMSGEKETVTFYTVVYDVRGDRQKHDEWWRMIHRLPDGISIKASANFDALTKLDELEGDAA